MPVYQVTVTGGDRDKRITADSYSADTDGFTRFWKKKKEVYSVPTSRVHQIQNLDMKENIVEV